MLTRNLENTILEDLKVFRILNLKGSRQCGKTTMVRNMAQKHNFDYYTFDNPKDVNFAKKMPQEFVAKANENTVILDEIQKYPEIIPYIKMQVDNNNKPGQFILTGSADLLKMKKVNESLAGRTVDFELMTFSLSELHNTKKNIIDKLINGQIINQKTELKNHNKTIWEFAIKGGYPETQNLSVRQRKNWYKSYVDSRIIKDLDDIALGGLQKLDLLPKMLKFLSWQAGDLLNYSSAAGELGIDVKTLKSYINFFDTLFLTKILVPYFKNIGKRQVKTSKFYFSDSGLLSYFLNVDVLPDLTFTGKIVENFIYNEIMKHNSTAINKADFYFYRDKEQYEVDLIMEYNFNDIIAIEIKAKEILKTSDFKGIRKLKRILGDQVKKAYVFYAGNYIYPTKTEEGIDIWALPFSVFLT